MVQRWLRVRPLYSASLTRLCSLLLVVVRFCASVAGLCRHVFGLKADVSSGIHYLEDNCVIYPAGHNIVLYSTDTKTQRFIHGRCVALPFPP
jgi:hypothetical protein